MKYLTFVFIFLICGFGFHSSHADVQVTSNYGMVLSGNDIKSLFSKMQLKGAESHQLQDFFIEQPYKTRLEGVSLSGNYDAGLTPGESLASFSLKAKMSALHMKVRKISTDTVIHRVVGGIQVEIFLKGSCENVEIQSADGVDMTAAVALGTETSGLTPSISGIAVNKLPQWHVNMGQCQGPLGYDKALMAEIQNILSNKEEIQKIIVGPMSSKLQAVAKSLNDRIFAPQEMAVSGFAKVHLKPESLGFLNNDHVLLSGRVTALLKSETGGGTFVDDPEFLARLSEAGQTGVYFSQKWVQSSVAKAQALRLFNYSFSSSAIESLKSLFSNRLYQFFLWPDLMRFARNATFLFDIHLNRLQKFSFAGVSDGALWYDVRGEGVVETQAPVKKAYRHYGDFASTLQSRVWVKMYKGVAVVGAHQPKFKLDFSWDKLYLSLFNPFKSISVSYFAGKIQSVLQKEKYSFAMPKLEVTEGAAMRADAIAGDEHVLLLRYSPNVP